MIDKRVAVITGGAGYLGSGYCELFARDGFAVVVADVRGEDAARVAAGIRASGGAAMPVEVDLTDEADAKRMVAEIEGEFGRLDILVNNAALFGRADHIGPVLEIDLDQWDAVMAVNVKGPLIAARAAVPLMARMPHGRIINVSSHAAYTKAGVYTLSKIALNSLTWRLAVEVGPMGITANAVAPGTMDTPTATSARGEAAIRESVKTYIVPRLGRPEDIYAAMKFFASPESAYCTGQTLVVNGGAHVHI